MNPVIKQLNRRLNITIKNQQLILQAFRHSSYINENYQDILASNERLEFLGDAVLEIAVSEYLYHTYPQESEGNLTRMRAQLVREESLAYIARENHLASYIQLGRGEKASGGNERDSILSDAFEALIGALYLDQGMKVVRDFLKQVLFNKHEFILKTVNQDYKTKFQELVQVNGNVDIEYRLLDKIGPTHQRIFEMGLYLNGQFLSKGQGKSKKLAEMQAAKAAYQELIGRE